MGDRIREYRRIHGLSQKKLAAQLGIDPTTLAGWERGKHQPKKRLIIGNFFSAPPCYAHKFVLKSHPATADKHKSLFKGCRGRLEDGAGQSGAR